MTKVTREIHIGNHQAKITSDDNYLKHMADHFEPNQIDLFSRILNKSDTVLDIGANIGITSIFFPKGYNQVYSFEPYPISF